MRQFHVGDCVRLVDNHYQPGVVIAKLAGHVTVRWVSIGGRITISRHAESALKHV